VLRNTQCASYPAGSPREEFADAVELFAGLRAGGGFNNDNTPFFSAFASAWGKATTNGLGDLVPLVSSPNSFPTPLQSSSVPTFGTGTADGSTSVCDLLDVLSVSFQYFFYY